MPTLSYSDLGVTIDSSREVCIVAIRVPNASHPVRPAVLKINPATDFDPNSPDDRPFAIRHLLPNRRWLDVRMLQYKQSPELKVRNRAIEEIAQAFQKYVRFIANRRWTDAGRVGGEKGLDDITSAGREGLFFAIEKWSPEKNKAISNLASVWIMNSCKQEIARLKNGAYSTPNRIKAMMYAYNAEENKESYLKKAKCRADTKQIIRTCAGSVNNNTISIDMPTNDEPNSPTLQDALPSEDTGIRTVEENDLRGIIREIFNKLKPRERFIFQRLHPDVVPASSIGEIFSRKNEVIPVMEIQKPWTLEKIGGMIGVSRERIRQIHEEVFMVVRSELQSRGICSANA